MSVCLVTGGAGFIGSHIVRRLVDLGHRVRVLDNFSTGRRDNLADVESQIELVIGDIGEGTACERCADGAEIIFHLAALGSVPRSVERPRETHNVNLTGTFNMLMAARKGRARRFIYSASSSAYGDTPVLPKSVDMRPMPLSPYAVTKLAGEYYTTAFSRVYGMETVSLRYFNVFGPRQDPNSQYAAVIPAWVAALLRGAAPIVYGDGEQSRDFCYVDNVVDANLAAAGLVPGMAEGQRLDGAVVNIACGEQTTLNRMLGMLNDLLGTRIAAEYRERRRGDVMHSLADISDARRLIGYEPRVFFADGLRRTVEWYQSQAR